MKVQWQVTLANNDTRLRASADEVQRKLGSCLLRLQGYELLLKAVLSQHHFSTQFADSGAVQTERSSNIDRKTLGNLVGHLLSTFLVPEGEQGQSLTPADGLGISYQLQVVVSDDDYSRIVSDLKELVILRNHLVHHFLEHHSLESVSGCDVALSDLAETLAKITCTYTTLREWAEDAECMKRRMSEFVASPEFEHFIREGRFPWPITVIVQALQQAEGELSANGWTPVATATKWISERYPEEQPDDYGCRSWRQVIHESGLFELRYIQIDGPRQAWFRSKGSVPDTR